MYFEDTFISIYSFYSPVSKKLQFKSKFVNQKIDRKWKSFLPSSIALNQLTPQAAEEENELTRRMAVSADFRTSLYVL